MDIFKREESLKLKKRFDELDEKIQVIHQNINIIWRTIENRERREKVISFPVN